MINKEEKFVIGIDYGTDSVRATIVDCRDGREVATKVSGFERWMRGDYCDPATNQFRQHPLDYVEGLEDVVTSVLAGAARETARNIVGISIDTTGSTPCAVDKQGVPLSMKPEHKDNPNAMFILWKDHTALKEADDINFAARHWGGTDFTKYAGGIYSSEWFWAKLLRVLRLDPVVRENAYSWIEHCDWIPALLTGSNDITLVRRSRCAAGHKAMWHRSFNGLPDEEFLVAIDPLLKGVRARLFTDTFTSDAKAGVLSAEWAERLGLSTNVVVGVGAFDAHMGAVGGGIRPYALSKVMGTSTCDMLVVPLGDIKDKLVRGICGQVDGSIIPGMMGLEAGQSGFGDIYAWFKKLLMWPLENIVKDKQVFSDNVLNGLSEKIDELVIPGLSAEAEKLMPGESGIVALDWHNGRRTPDANQFLKGAITGLNLGSNAPRIFRSLVEGTAFGAKKIVDRFSDQGIEIREVMALGGVAKKSPFIMQIVADVLDKKIEVVRSEQACALGAAMFAATAAGIHKTVEEAQSVMESGFEREYVPDRENVVVYRKLFERYSALGDFIEAAINKERSNG